MHLWEILTFLFFFLYCFATGLTVCYTFRLVYYTFSGRFNLHSLYFVRDESYQITNPILFLRGGAIFGGAFLRWLIFPRPDIICITFIFKTLALRVRILGGLIGYILNLIITNYKLICLKFYNYVNFIGCIWFIPFLSTYVTARGSLMIRSLYTKVSDFGWSEFYGGQGVYKTIIENSNYLQVAQDNSFKVYTLSFIVWVTSVFIFI